MALAKYQPIFTRARWILLNINCSWGDQWFCYSKFHDKLSIVRQYFLSASRDCNSSPQCRKLEIEHCLCGRLWVSCIYTTWQKKKKKKKTATTIMHKIRTPFLSRSITRLAQWRSLLRLRASLLRSAIKLYFLILHDRTGVLILCIIVVAVFLARVVLRGELSPGYTGRMPHQLLSGIRSIVQEECSRGVLERKKNDLTYLLVCTRGRISCSGLPRERVVFVDANGNKEESGGGGRVCNMRWNNPIQKISRLQRSDGQFSCSNNSDLEVWKGARRIQTRGYRGCRLSHCTLNTLKGNSVSLEKSTEAWC